MTDYEDLQKRCQRGATNLNEANNLLAECYGLLGKLGAERESASKHWANESNNVQALTAEVVRLKAENEALRKALTYIRDTTDDWHIVEKAADALIDSARKEG